MVPSVWDDKNGSHAEALIYRKLRQETPDDWLAVHSVGLTSHADKPWAEIDFVVIGPFGVLCLEVKGGRIKVAEGSWTTNERPLRESPFSQAGGGAAALHHDLDWAQALRRAVVGYGVLFPDVTFTAMGPGIEAEIVYDDRDLDKPISAYLKRIADRWLRFHGRTGDRFRPLSRSERTVLLSFIAPSFELIPGLRARIAAAEAELISLTRDQARILRGFRHEDRAFIRGGAGTGKTLLAVEEAARHAAAGHRVLMCCRSLNLAHFIGEHVEESLIEVRPYEELLWDLVDAAGRRVEIPDAEDADVLDVFLPELAAEAAIDLGRAGAYDVLVLDEAQDLLMSGALDVLDVLLNGGLEAGVWRVFLDHRQNVFEAVDLVQLDRIREAAGTRYELVENCRNTPQIAETTAMLSAVDPDEMLAGDGPDVETRFVLDRREEVSAAASVVSSWLRRGVQPDDVVVVGLDEPTTERMLSEWPSHAQTLVPFPAPQPGAVRALDAQSFKGLEASAVVVVGLREIQSTETLRRIYVGCSRARVLLAVILDESSRDDFNLRAVEYARRAAECH